MCFLQLKTVVKAWRSVGLCGSNGRLSKINLLIKCASEARSKTRVTIGLTLTRFRDLKERQRLISNAD